MIFVQGSLSNLQILFKRHDILIGVTELWHFRFTNEETEFKLLAQGHIISLSPSRGSIQSSLDHISLVDSSSLPPSSVSERTLTTNPNLVDGVRTNSRHLSVAVDFYMLWVLLQMIDSSDPYFNNKRSAFKHYYSLS